MVAVGVNLLIAVVAAVAAVKLDMIFLSVLRVCV